MKPYFINYMENVQLTYFQTLLAYTTMNSFSPEFYFSKDSQKFQTQHSVSGRPKEVYAIF